MRNKMLFWSLSGFGILLAFNNCAEQRFSSEKLQIASLLTQSGGIIINRGEDFTQSKTVSLDIAADGAKEMYITNDSHCNSGGEWERFSTHRLDWQLNEENVKTSVYVKFKTAGGIESTCLSDSIIHDNLAPKITFTRAPDLITAARQAQFSIAVDEKGSGLKDLECTGSSDQTFQPCNSIVSKPVSAQGTQQFKVRARDQAGNISATYAYSWLTDWTPPTIDWNKVPAKLNGSNSATLSFSASDDLSGIKELVCFNPLTNQEVSCNSGTLELTQLKDGNYNVKVKAIDKAGNSSSWKEYAWQVDLTAPTIEITSTPKPFENRNQAQFSFQGKDGNNPISSYKCRIDSSAFNSCVSGTSFSVTEGTHRFEVAAIDDVGNISSPASYSWIVDNHAPTLQWSSTPNTYSNEINPKLNLSANDAGGSGIEKIVCSIDGNPIECNNYAISLMNITEGKREVSAFAIDKAGNTSSTIKYAWNVDLTPPTVQLTKTPLALSTAETDSFQFLAQDNMSSILISECRLDNEAFSSCTSPREVKNLSQGPHRFEIRSMDAAGNKSNIVGYNWIVDSMGPKIVILSQPSDHNYGIEDKIQYVVEDDYSPISLIECGWANSLKSCNAADTLSFSVLPGGNYKFVIKATDQLNNVSFAEINWQVQVNVEPNTQTLAVSEKNNSVDILFVVDNSGSMKEEQLEIKNRISGFIDKIKNIDWQIAVTSTDPNSSASWGDGKFRPFSANKNILISTDLNAQTLLGDAVYMGSEGSGDERGINATYRVIERANASKTSDQGQFIRKDAALATIVLSDEDECSTGCASNIVSSSPNGLLNLVSSKLGTNKRFVFHSIVYRPGTVCKTGYNAGNIYKQLTTLTNGILGDVCASNYTNQLAGIADSVVDLVTSVQLKCAPFDSNNDGQVDLNIYKVAADGTKSIITNKEFPYTVENKLIKFASALPIGNYQFDYNCLK